MSNFTGWFDTCIANDDTWTRSCRWRIYRPGFTGIVVVRLFVDICIFWCVCLSTKHVQYTIKCVCFVFITAGSLVTSRNRAVCKCTHYRPQYMEVRISAHIFHGKPTLVTTLFIYNAVHIFSPTRLKVRGTIGMVLSVRRLASFRPSVPTFTSFTSYFHIPYTKFHETHMDNWPQWGKQHLTLWPLKGQGHRGHGHVCYFPDDNSGVYSSIFTKPGWMIDLTSRNVPINFKVTRSKVKVTGAILYIFPFPLLFTCYITIW